MRDHDQVDPYLDVFPDDAIDVYDFLLEVGRVDVEPVGIKQLDQAKENIGIFRRGAAPTSWRFKVQSSTLYGLIHKN